MHTCVINMPLVDKANRKEGSVKPSQKSFLRRPEKRQNSRVRFSTVDLQWYIPSIWDLSHFPNTMERIQPRVTRGGRRWFLTREGVLFSFRTGGRFGFHQNSRSVSQDRVCVQRGEQRGEGRRVGQRWSVKISLIWFRSADKSLTSLCTALNFYFWIWIFSFSFSSHKPLDNDWK